MFPSCPALGPPLQVNAKFGKLYSLKVSIFVTEVLSVLLTPLVLFFSLPNCAADIIDFFRDVSSLLW